MKKALINGIILTKGHELTGKALLVDSGKIQDIIAAGEVDPDNYPVVDLDGDYLAPGLIDLQIYGSGGMLFGGIPSPEALQQMEGDLLSEGTTGFLAAVATNTPEIVLTAIRSAKTYRQRAKGNFWGLHLEGPYLNPARRGAHPGQLVKKGSVEELRQWIDQAEGEIRMMTIAPELQDDEVLDLLHRNNIVISCGHSNASYAEANDFFRNKPVSTATHLYNAMPPIHHREAGLVPAIFKQRPYTSIIADGVHVSFPMIELAKRELGERLFLITDAVTETSEGVYPHVFAGDRYTMPDGTLSGSCLTMLKSVQNCVEQVGIDLPEAIRMASEYPAMALGEGARKGLLAKDCDADMIRFNKLFEPVETFLRGNSVGYP